MKDRDEVLSAEEREWIADEERWVGSTTASRIVRRLADDLAAARREVTTARAAGAREGAHLVLDGVEEWLAETRTEFAALRARYPRPAEPHAPGPGGAP